jgi:hypothetical protein
MKKRNWFFLGALVLYVWESIVAFHWVRPVVSEPPSGKDAGQAGRDFH